jgi:hypothetical protein
MSSVDVARGIAIGSSALWLFAACSSAPLASNTPNPALAKGVTDSGVAGAPAKPPMAAADSGASGSAGTPHASAGTGGAAAVRAGSAAPAPTGGAGGAAQAGAGGAAGAAPSSNQLVTTAEQSAATKAWWAYERAAKYTVIKSSEMVPTRDGTMLGCTLSRPGESGAAATGQFPGLIVEYTPYALNADNNNAEAAFFAQRGYNALVCTLRGIGQSGGTWQNAASSQDGRDAYDLVEWLAVQAYSDGRIGQLGESYGGGTSNGAAIEQPPHLRAIAPMQSPSDLYNDVIFPGGIESTQGGTINNWPPVGQLLSLGKINAQAEYDVGHAHPTYDAFWQDRTIVGRVASIQVPVLAIGGWVDGYFRSGAIANIEAAPERTWAIYGAWAHLPVVDIGQCTGGACAADPLPSGVLLAWFDHWVMELPDLPIPAKPNFVSFECPKGASHGWRELSAWSAQGADADALTFELGSDSTLAQSAKATESMTFHEPGEPTASGAALTFTSAALDADHVLLGHGSLDLHVKLSAADANFYVELLDLDSADKETLVNDGFLKASHRTSHTNPEPVPVGQSVEYHIDVRPQHYRFAAGHRVRVRLSGGAKNVLVPAAAVDVTLETGDHATLRLPGFASKAL